MAQKCKQMGLLIPTLSPPHTGVHRDLQNCSCPGAGPSVQVGRPQKYAEKRLPGETGSSAGEREAACRSPSREAVREGRERWGLLPFPHRPGCWTAHFSGSTFSEDRTTWETVGSRQLLAAVTRSTCRADSAGFMWANNPDSSVQGLPGVWSPPRSLELRMHMAFST